MLLELEDEEPEVPDAPTDEWLYSKLYAWVKCMYEESNGSWGIYRDENGNGESHLFFLNNNGSNPDNTYYTIGGVEENDGYYQDTEKYPYKVSVTLNVNTFIGSFSMKTGETHEFHRELMDGVGNSLVNRAVFYYNSKGGEWEIPDVDRTMHDDNEHVRQNKAQGRYCLVAYAQPTGDVYQWLNVDGKVLSKKYAHAKDGIPVYTGQTPVNKEDETLAFAGWTESVGTTENGKKVITYTAMYGDTPAAPTDAWLYENLYAQVACMYRSADNCWEIYTNETGEQEVKTYFISDYPNLSDKYYTIGEVEKYTQNEAEFPESPDPDLYSYRVRVSLNEDTFRNCFSRDMTEEHIVEEEEMCLGQPSRSDVAVFYYNTQMSQWEIPGEAGTIIDDDNMHVRQMYFNDHYYLFLALKPIGDTYQWVNADGGEILERKNLHADGRIPSYTGKTPVNKNNKELLFTGWSGPVETMENGKKVMTYTAMYDDTPAAPTDAWLYEKLLVEVACMYQTTNNFWEYYTDAGGNKEVVCYYVNNGSNPNNYFYTVGAVEKYTEDGKEYEDYPDPAVYSYRVKVSLNENTFLNYLKNSFGEDHVVDEEQMSSTWPFFSRGDVAVFYYNAGTGEWEIPGEAGEIIYDDNMDVRQMYDGQYYHLRLLAKPTGDTYQWVNADGKEILERKNLHADDRIPSYTGKTPVNKKNTNLFFTGWSDPEETTEDGKKIITYKALYEDTPAAPTDTWLLEHLYARVACMYKDPEQVDTWEVYEDENGQQEDKLYWLSDGQNENNTFYEIGAVEANEGKYNLGTHPYKVAVTLNTDTFLYSFEKNMGKKHTINETLMEGYGDSRRDRAVFYYNPQTKDWEIPGEAGTIIYDDNMHVRQSIREDGHYSLELHVEPVKMTYKWINTDGRVLSEKQLDTHDKAPDYDGETPVNPEDERAVFTGWSDPEETTEGGKEVVTYTAEYVEIPDEEWLAELLGDFVTIDCVNATLDLAHDDSSYGVLKDSITYSPVSREDDSYSCTVSVNIEKFLEKYNESTGELHVLSEAVSAYEILLKWNKTERKWETASADNAFTLKVRCGVPSANIDLNVKYYYTLLSGEEVTADRTDRFFREIADGRIVMDISGYADYAVNSAVGSRTYELAQVLVEEDGSEVEAETDNGRITFAAQSDHSYGVKLIYRLSEEETEPDPGTTEQPDPGTQNPGTTEQPDPGTQNPGTTEQPDPGTQNPGTTEQPDPGTQNPGTTEQPGPGTTEQPGPGTSNPGTPEQSNPETPSVENENQDQPVQTTPAVTETVQRTVTALPAAQRDSRQETASAEEERTELINIENEETPLASAEDGGLQNREEKNPAKETVLEDEEVPLAMDGGTWALLNLLLAALTVLVSAVLLAACVSERKKKGSPGEFEENEKDELRGKGAVQMLSVLPAAAAVVFFVLTENMGSRMVFVDKWTLWMAVFAAADGVFAALTLKKRGEENALKK